jgi:transcriptional regulator with XRE-family HTH domain
LTALFNEKLIQQFKALRIKKGISQQALNDRVGVADNVIAKWENGHRNPTGFNLHCWAEALGARLILEDTNGQKPKGQGCAS